MHYGTVQCGSAIAAVDSISVSSVQFHAKMMQHISMQLRQGTVSRNNRGDDVKAW